jgi:fatty-acyl-CoA synthase
VKPSPVHNVGAWTGRRAAARGEQIAVIDADRRLDYASLHARTLRCAALLRGAGLAAGERVALLLGNRSAYLEIVMAAARLGAIAVPINTRLTAREVRQLIADCAPKLVIHEEAASALTAEACAGLEPSPARIACPGDYELRLLRAIPDERLAPVTPDHPMLLMYTSGTTGTPKGALLPHRKALFNSLNAQLFFDLTHHDRVLVVLPLFHSFGLSILSLPTLYCGGSIHLEPRFEPDLVWQRVAERRITFMGGVPTQLRSMLDALDRAPTRYDRSSLRFLFSAGAPIAIEDIRAFEAHGLLLKQGFGQTETSILCCLDARDALRKAGSVGKPVFHADVRVVALATLERAVSEWRDIAPGETGEIVVRGPITMLEYWGQAVETAETLRGEWLRTGDLASVDAEGFLTLVGRARDLYISGGENVYPAEIEAIYAMHPDVKEIAVVGVPDAKWGEVGHAFVVPVPGARVSPDALLAWGAARLARFKLPKRFVALEHLPRTETGKVQKQRLRGETLPK